jgi:hypothetical protein
MDLSSAACTASSKYAGYAGCEMAFDGLTYQGEQVRKLHVCNHGKITSIFHFRNLRGSAEKRESGHGLRFLCQKRLY